MSHTYLFEVFYRDLTTGEPSDFYASGEAPTREQAERLAAEYTDGDYWKYATFFYLRTRIE